MNKSDFLKTRMDNIGEFLSMGRDYVNTYFRLLFTEDSDPKLRSSLLKSIYDYYLITKEENKYLHFIQRNSKQIQNLETLSSILEDLDELNERTYYFYQSLLETYELPMQDKTFFKSLYEKDFKTLIETRKYEAELLGLFLTEKDLDAYYQKEDAYYYLKERTKIWNSSAEEGKGYFGLFTEEDGNTIKEIKLCVPKITDLKTMLINIHEFKHGISLYPFIGTSMPNIDFETEAKLEEEHFVSKYLLKK